LKKRNYLAGFRKGCSARRGEGRMIFGKGRKKRTDKRKENVDEAHRVIVPTTFEEKNRAQKKTTEGGGGKRRGRESQGGI